MVGSYGAFQGYRFHWLLMLEIEQSFLAFKVLELCLSKKMYNKTKELYLLM